METVYIVIICQENVETYRVYDVFDSYEKAQERLNSEAFELMRDGFFKNTDHNFFVRIIERKVK